MTDEIKTTNSLYADDVTENTAADRTADPAETADAASAASGESRVIWAALKIARAMRRSAPRKNAPAFPPAVGRALHVIARNENISSRELCEKLDVRPSSLSELLARMEARGLIVRTPDENDRRIVRIALSETAKTDLAARRADRKAEAEKLTACFTAEEAAAFVALADKLSAHLEALAGEDGDGNDNGPRGGHGYRGGHGRGPIGGGRGRAPFEGRKAPFEGRCKAPFEGRKPGFSCKSGFEGRKAPFEGCCKASFEGRKPGFSCKAHGNWHRGPVHSGCRRGPARFAHRAPGFGPKALRFGGMRPGFDSRCAGMTAPWAAAAPVYGAYPVLPFAPAFPGRPFYAGVRTPVRPVYPAAPYGFAGRTRI